MFKGKRGGIKLESGYEMIKNLSAILLCSFCCLSMTLPALPADSNFNETAPAELAVRKRINYLIDSAMSDKKTSPLTAESDLQDAIKLAEASGQRLAGSEIVAWEQLLLLYEEHEKPPAYANSLGRHVFICGVPEHDYQQKIKMLELVKRKTNDLTDAQLDEAEKKMLSEFKSYDLTISQCATPTGDCHFKSIRQVLDF